MKECGLLESIPPIGVWELGVDEYGPDPLDECAVHAFRDSVALWRVRGRHLVYDDLVPEKRLDFARGVLASSVRM